MRIDFMNLNESDVEELRTFEKKNSDQCMLAITKDAFDGNALATLILTGIQTVVSVITLILTLKEINAAANKVNGVDAKEVEIIIHSPNGSTTCIKLTDVTKEALLSILNLYL